MRNTTSPWKDTPKYGKFLGYYEPTPIPDTGEEIYVTLKNPIFVHRPDVLADYLYGRPGLGWLFGAINGWDDPIFDLEIGKRFKILPPVVVKRYWG